MASYGYTFQSGDGVTPTRLNDARTVSNIVNADIKSDAAIAGTKIAPNFGSQNVTTTGALSAGAGSVISAASSTDALRITQTGAGNALLVEDANPDSTPFVVDLSGAVISGHTSAIDTIHDAQTAIARTYRSQVHGDTAFGAGQALVCWDSNAAGLYYAPNLVLARSASGTVGAMSAVSDDMPLGSISFNGDDGTAFVKGARIEAYVDGTPGANDMPGRLVFSTTADGASTPTERMRIDSSGSVGIGTSSPNAAALLDVSSTTKGFLPPRMTTAQRDAISTPPAGLVVYNTSTNVLNFYNGSAWAAV